MSELAMTIYPTIVDLTAKTPPAFRIKNRPADKITSVILHQMAFSRGSVPENYLDVRAHFALLPDGRVVHLHPVEKYVISSSMFNDIGIAVEVVGNFANDRGTYWQGDTFGRHTLTKQQIDGGRNLIVYLRDVHKISCVFTHRQGEKATERGNCPGPDIWFHIGEWAVDLGLSDGGPGYHVPPGSPIPESWRKERQK